MGTSGIVVPGNKQSFPADFQSKSRLSYYASLFNTLEINSTFKKLPLARTVERWRDEVPENFRFTIKLWKELTHVKQLNIDLNNLDLFFERINLIGDKKDCLLLQFPPLVTADYSDRLEQILQRLQQLDQGNEWRKAVELRSTTWYVDETYKLLDKYNASLVLHDMPKSKILETKKGGKFVYFRFHGTTGNYRGDYSTEFFEDQAKNIAAALSSGKDAYVYFNNTLGNAFGNAMSLKAMVDDLVDKAR
jgi:uncharacterized protein YecE (DUF72 family)